MAVVDLSDAWTMDRQTLVERVTDRSRLDSALATAEPADRLWLLRLLGRLDQGLAEARELLADVGPDDDPWPVLGRAAELHRDARDFDGARRLHEVAWKHARSRSRQATTIQQVGERWWFYGDRDAAASCFELALTMRRGFDGDELVDRSQTALTAARRVLGYDAIVLAGGRGSRSGAGAGKPGIPLVGWPLVDHVLLAAAGAGRQVVVGPRRMTLGEPVFCREEPAGAGPVAAIAAAAELLSADMVAVLAADLPFVGPALDTLRMCITFGDRDAAVLVDISGRANYLAAVWRTSALRRALDRIGDPAGVPVRALYEGMDTALAPDFDALGADCDTRDDLRVAEERIRRRDPGRLPAALLAWPRLELHSPS